MRIGPLSIERRVEASRMVPRVQGRERISLIAQYYRVSEHPDPDVRFHVGRDIYRDLASYRPLEKYRYAICWGDTTLSVSRLKVS